MKHQADKILASFLRKSRERERLFPLGVIVYGVQMHYKYNAVQVLIFNTKGGSRTAATSWKPLTIITKRSILDVAAALDPPLNTIQIQSMMDS